jgi:hypothetical protein
LIALTSSVGTDGKAFIAEGKMAVEDAKGAYGLITKFYRNVEVIICVDPLITVTFRPMTTGPTIIDASDVRTNSFLEISYDI